MAGSTLNFALLFVGACVAMAGVGGFLVVAEEEYHAEYRGADDRIANGERVVYYEQLSPDERALFERTVERGYAEDDETLLPEVVRRDERYHRFRTYATFDWSSPYTVAPTAAGAVGVGLVVAAVRRDRR